MSRQYRAASAKCSLTRFCSNSTVVNLLAFLRRSCPLHTGAIDCFACLNEFRHAHSKVLQAGDYHPDFDVLVSLRFCPRAPSRTQVGGQILSSCVVQEMAR